MKIRVLGVIGLGLLGTWAAAEPVNGKVAKQAVFAPVQAEVEILPAAGLPKDQARALEMVGGAQPYYGAIAISPQDGLMSEATVAAANYHDTDAASVVALAECNAKKTAKKPCVVAALIRPKGWQERGFQLSSDATAGFRAEYDAKSGALAISVATGSWGLGSGTNAKADALADCAAKPSRPKDCTVVIAN